MKRFIPHSRSTMRVDGLVAAKDGYLIELGRLARDEASCAEPLFAWLAVEGLRQRLAETSRRAAELCLRQGLEPADLAGPSRRAFQLMSYLGEGRRLEEHLDTLRRLSAAGKGDGQIVGSLDHSGSLYRIERHSQAIRLILSEGFLGAPDAVLAALTRLATPYARKRQPRQEVREYTEGRRFAEVLRQVEEAGGAYRSRPAGSVYDLGELFDRVNRQYFGERLAPPRLLWSERVPSVEFGHFEPATDTVRISRRLDSPDVPSFVLEHVMHHELLHRLLGAERQGGKRRYHSTRFRREEKGFAHYEEAEAILHRLARA